MREERYDPKHDKLEAAIAAMLFELSDKENDRFENCLERDEALRSTYAQLENVVAKTSFALPKATPPSFIKENVLRYVAEESQGSRLWGSWLASLAVGASNVTEAGKDAGSRILHGVRRLSPQQAIGFSFVLFATFFGGAYAFESIREFIAPAKPAISAEHVVAGHLKPTQKTTSYSIPEVKHASQEFAAPNVRLPQAAYVSPKGSVVRIPDQIVSHPTELATNIAMPDAKSVTESIQTNFGTVEAYLRLSGDPSAWSYDLAPRAKNSDATATVLWDNEHRDALLVVGGLPASEEHSQYLLQYVLRDGSIVNALTFTTISKATLYTFIPTAPGVPVLSTRLVLQRLTNGSVTETVLLQSGKASKNG